MHQHRDAVTDVTDARLRRFIDYLHATYMVSYAPKTDEERRWIADGGEPPAIVASYYRHATKGVR